MNEKGKPDNTLVAAEAPGQAETRKSDHIELAFRSRTARNELDPRFYYEPLLSGHPNSGSLKPFTFLGKTLHTPIWVSSMTGGAQLAFQINTVLARACNHFGMGMGLGSCRSLLTSDEHIADFDVRDLLGDALPLYANLGIAQVEKLLDQGALHLIDDLILRLRADGLIIHLNPMQEWFQPEGDRIQKAPLHTLQQLVRSATYPIIVKEVGQGMGYQSLKHLLHLPLAAVDFGAAGGTNFALLENLRRKNINEDYWAPLVKVGHDAEEMMGWVNAIVEEKKGKLPCQQIIISGGVKDFLDGYYLMQKSALPSIYGQASGLLNAALEGDTALHTFLEAQIRGLEMAHAFLKVK